MCLVDRLGFARADELGAADAAQLMLAGLTYAWLAREGMPPRAPRRSRASSPGSRRADHGTGDTDRRMT